MDENLIAAAIRYAEFLREKVDENKSAPPVVGVVRLHQFIDALLSALEASPVYLKAAKLGLPTFVLIASDRAAPAAIRMWAKEAEQHGCRKDKVDKARRISEQWDERTDTYWPGTR